VHVGCLIVLTVFRQSLSIFVVLHWGSINILGSSPMVLVCSTNSQSVGTGCVLVFLNHTVGANVSKRAGTGYF
jgi:hypothetical protein